ncbi:MAG: PGF-pre-PGF domain-containing protein, partial [Candidatus Aenigmatarchaeota archaeon]
MNKKLILLLSGLISFLTLSQNGISCDITISSCSNLNEPYKVYCLSQNIVDSTSTYCINISSNNIILDCRGYMIDGRDTDYTYGIYINRNFLQDTNITIKNCIITDWRHGILLENVKNCKIINSVLNSNRGYGVNLSSSSNNQIINLTSNSNFIGGILLSSSSNNQIINLTSNSNSNFGIYFYLSSNNQIINSTFYFNSYGLYFSSSSSNTIKGGSVALSSVDDYSLIDSTNDFINTNFTQPRNIYLYTPSSWFNYNNRIDINLWLNTALSSLYTTITRNVLKWGREEVKWNELASKTTIAFYNLAGLLPNAWYEIYNGTQLTYKQKTDSQGNLRFNLTLTLTPREIKVSVSPNQPPTLTDIWESPKDPATYSFGQTYRFNVTVCDSDGADDISTVIFEWGSNTTVSSFITHNSTCRNYTTTKTDLPAYSYYEYKWYVKDSNNAWTSISGSYTINKAKNILGSLTCSPSLTITYPTQTTCTGSQTALGDSDVVYYLFRNNVLVDEQTNNNPSETILLGAGSYVYKFISLSGQNYTENSTGLSLTLIVNQNTSTATFMNLLINSTEGSKNYNYPTATNVTGYYSSSVFSGQSITFTLYRNTTTIGSSNPIYDIRILPVGVHQYIYNTSGNQNYSSASKSYLVTISQGQPQVTISFINNNTVYGNIQTVKCNITMGEQSATLTLLRNGTVVASGSGNQSYTAVHGAGWWNYTCIYASQGYSSSSATAFLYVQKATPSLNLLLNEQANNIAVAYPSQTNATGYETNTGDSDLTYTLYRNTTIIGLGSNVQDVLTLGAAVYVYVYNTSGGANYTANSITRTLIVNKGPNPVDIYFITTTETYKNQNITVIAGTQITVNVTAVYPNSGTLSLYEDGLPVTNPRTTILSVGEHSYKGNITGNQNYTSNLTGATFYINVIGVDNNPPKWCCYSINSTIPGSTVLHRIFWQDDVQLDYAIFSFDNCTGSFRNISTIKLSGSQVWSNFTVIINETIGCTIRWKVYANDTSNNWNVSETFSFITSLESYCGNGVCELVENCSNCLEDCPCPGSAGCCGNSCGCPEGKTCKDETCVAECSQDFVALDEEKNITLVVKCINESQTRSFNFSKFIFYNLTLKANFSIYDFIIRIQKIPESLIDLSLRIDKKAYYYLDFSKENLEEKTLEKIIANFKVEKSWVYSENINISTISLYRLSTSWEKLKTYKIDEDSSFLYFESELPGFSIFAIAGEEKLALPLLECPVCPESSEWSECIEGKRNRTSYYCSEETKFECIEYIETEECEEKKEE